MRAIVYIGTSLDGYIARKDGDIDWLTAFVDKDVEKSYKEFISRIDAIVIGRGTFEKVISFPQWPYEQKVFVLSNHLKHLPEAAKGKATIVAMEPRELLTFLSNEGYSNIYVDGGKVIQGFLKEDCIDEIIITQVPLLIGSGIPLFGDTGRDLGFRLIHTECLSGQLVKNHYERKRK